MQTALVAHGKYALQVHGLASKTDDYALIVSKSAPAALNGTHFGRANFYITPKPLTSGHTQMVFAGKNGTGAANGPGPFQKLRYMEVSNINGGWQAGFDLLDISPLIEEVVYPAGSPQVPTVTWACLEWQFTDAPDSVNFWIDGKLVGTFDDQHVSYPSGHAPGTPLYNGSSTGLIGGFELFGFGFHDWHPNKPFDLYLRRYRARHQARELLAVGSCIHCSRSSHASRRSCGVPAARASLAWRVSARTLRWRKS